MVLLAIAGFTVDPCPLMTPLKGDTTAVNDPPPPPTPHIHPPPPAQRTSLCATNRDLWGWGGRVGASITAKQKPCCDTQGGGGGVSPAGRKPVNSEHMSNKGPFLFMSAATAIDHERTSPEALDSDSARPPRPAPPLTPLHRPLAICFAAASK